MIKITNLADRALLVPYTKTGQRLAVPLNPGQSFEETEEVRDQIEKFGYGDRIKIEVLQ